MREEIQKRRASVARRVTRIGRCREHSNRRMNVVDFVTEASGGHWPRTILNDAKLFAVTITRWATTSMRFTRKLGGGAG